MIHKQQYDISISNTHNTQHTHTHTHTHTHSGLVQGFVALPTYMLTESTEVLWTFLQQSKEVNQLVSNRVKWCRNRINGCQFVLSNCISWCQIALSGVTLALSGITVASAGVIYLSIQVCLDLLQSSIQKLPVKSTMKVTSEQQAAIIISISRYRNNTIQPETFTGETFLQKYFRQNCIYPFMHNDTHPHTSLSL